MVTIAVSSSVIVTVSLTVAPRLMSASPEVIPVSVTVTVSLSSSRLSSITVTSIVAVVALAENRDRAGERRVVAAGRGIAADRVADHRVGIARIGERDGELAIVGRFGGGGIVGRDGDFGRVVVGDRDRVADRCAEPDVGVART